jgi:small glutamine-rich tetratricopeptide repeat-containing protein alpha
MAAASETTKKRLALAIIDYLNTSVTDGTISSEEAESIEIATNCIGEAFKVDASDEAAVKDAVGGQSLLSIYNVYEKLKGKGAPTSKGPGGAAGAQSATPATSGGSVDAKTKDEADKLKAQGNAAMQKKDYTSAIDLYTQALNLNPLNPIYLSNRAAAYSGALRHEEAKGDAEMAVAADPGFAKAWSRLGLAKFALGDAKGSMEAYQKGIEAEGSGGSDAMRKGFETAKRKVEEEGGDSEEDIGSSRDPMAGMGGAGGMPDLSSLAGMFGGGGAGGGGMPDMAGLMNNPMMRQMAQNLMSNPDAMSSLLNNPRLAEMASQFGGGGGGAGAGGGAGGGGMPDLSSLMQDPSIREM